MSSQKDNRQANLTRGIRVEIASLVYNIIEVVVSVTVGLLTGSAALVSWGLDSTVEATSAGTLIWRLKAEKAEAAGGVSTPATQDAAWVTSKQHPWRRAEGDGRRPTRSRRRRPDAAE